jgi:hypothetical protein
MRHSLRVSAAFALLMNAVVFANAESSGKAPLPSGVIARASGDIVEAALIGLTTRYQHFVLGTPYEAAGLRVRTNDGRVLDIQLPEDAVFEDRQPRIADLDNDGRNEIAVVISRQSTGSALAVLGLRDGALKILAESTPNGAPRRWLNPAGIGRFLNNGRRQVALVRMPHAVGRLEFWDFDGSKLTLHGAIEDTSNHRAGTDKMNLSAVIPRKEPQSDLLAVPDFNRRNLRIIAALPSPHQVAIFPLKSSVVGDLKVSRVAKGITIRVPLTEGAIQEIVLSQDILSK